MIYLSEEYKGFYKSKSQEKSGSSQEGQTRGGKYVARVQIGYEKDGSPKYRYFKTQKEYDSYLSGSGKKKERDASTKKRSKELASKVKKERDASKEYTESSKTRKEGVKKQTSHRMSAEARREAEKKTDKITKSLKLYIEV